jgi:hypothetical protein
LRALDRFVDWLRGTDPRARLRVAVALTLVCALAWPATSLTVFRSEPQGVLALSWVALIVAFLTLVATTDVRDDLDD